MIFHTNTTYIIRYLPPSLLNQRVLKSRSGTHRVHRVHCCQAKQAGLRGHFHPCRLSGNEIRIARASSPCANSSGGHGEIYEFADMAGLFLFCITDDGMQPLLNKGDMLMCRESRDLKNLAFGALAVLEIGGRYFLKRVYVKEDHVILGCDNWRYAELELGFSEIGKVWVVPPDFEIGQAEKTEFERRLDYMEIEVAKLRDRLKWFLGSREN